MTKSASEHITGAPGQHAHARSITPLPGPAPAAPSSPAPPPGPPAELVSFGSRIALWAALGGLFVLALQALSEPLHWLLQKIGLLH
jgi:hypothetical protein